MKRMHWKGDEPPDPNACTVVFKNAADTEVEIMWGGDEAMHVDKPLGTRIPPGTTSSMNSQRGHVFYLKRVGENGDGPLESNRVVCKPPKSRFLLNVDFKLQRAKAKKRNADEL